MKAVKYSQRRRRRRRRRRRNWRRRRGKEDNRTDGRGEMRNIGENLEVRYMDRKKVEERERERERGRKFKAVTKLRRV